MLLFFCFLYTYTATTIWHRRQEDETFWLRKNSNDSNSWQNWLYARW